MMMTKLLQWSQQLNFLKNKSAQVQTVETQKSVLSANSSRVKWYQSLRFQGLALLVLLAAWLLIGMLLVMNTRGKALVLDESARLTERIGNNAVSALLSRSREIAALTRTLATTTENLPNSVNTFKEVIPHLIDFGRDTGIEGGGIWPEPYTFDPEQERRSFFWARESDGLLKYYDDYNQVGSSYHQEEWYVPASYLKRSKSCYWSRSYTDPHSYEAMVTCTVPTYNGENFSGTVTIDLTLEGLQQFADRWQEETGGYIFIVDRNNKFITFPDKSLVRTSDTTDTAPPGMIDATTLATREPLFEPITEVLTDMNQQLIEIAAAIEDYSLSENTRSLKESIYAIETDEARLTAAILANPFQGLFSEETSNMYGKYDLADDFLLEEPSTLFLFHMPDTYWKLGVVKPISEATASATTIINFLVIYTFITILVAIALTYFALSRFLIRPLTQTTDAIQYIGDLVTERQYSQLQNYKLQTQGHNELAMLGYYFNELVSEVVESQGKLEEANASLEKRVEERTKELAKAYKRLKTSQTQLVQSEKMASLDQMVAGVTHEINTPLGYVKNNLKMIQDLFLQTETLVREYDKLTKQLISGEELDETTLAHQINTVAELGESLTEDETFEEIQELFKDSIYGVDQISELVVNLKNFSRLDQAKIADVNIQDCIESTLNIAHNTLKHRVTVEKQYGENLPKVACSPSQINQVLLNLVTNGAQAIEHDHGKLVIKTSADQKFVYVSIQDNGKGIPKEVLPQIFDPFFTTKPIGEGTGLGLSISHQIIHQHGGSIKVATKPNKGTRFLVSLPLETQLNQLEATEKLAA